MSKILCILPICCFPTNEYSCKGSERIQQYIDGFKKFFEYIEILNNYNVDIYIFDNTIDKNQVLPQEILEIIPSNVKIINDSVNNYGGINKGAGLIESWIYLKNIIEQYDFLIHFEPRQLLINFDFILCFLQNNANTFTFSKDQTQFNTGLFCIDCKILLYLISNINIEFMINNIISIETLLYNFFIENNIQFIVKDKMNLIWYPYVEQTVVLW